MKKQSQDDQNRPKRKCTRPADASPDPLPDDLTIAEILAEAPTAKPRRARGVARDGRLGASKGERDSLDQYLFEVSKTPLLTGEQEVALARRVVAGEPDAMQEMVKRNLRFVVSVAKKYQNRGMALADLIGEGNVGLITAAGKFDPDQKVKFISYAVWWIRQSILAALARQGRTVRVPLNRTADLSRIVRSAETLRQDLGREPTPEELGAATGLSVEIVQALAALNASEVRLDAPLSPDEDRSLMDRFVADEQGNPDAVLMDRFMSEEIDRALGLLPARDAKVLQLYFGLNDGREHTLEEIGTMLGVTRERVRQLRDRALRRLRDGAAGRILASFAA
jgi:RNA polymerase primary sigma factor